MNDDQFCTIDLAMRSTERKVIFSHGCQDETTPEQTRNIAAVKNYTYEEVIPVKVDGGVTFIRVSARTERQRPLYLIPTLS